MATQINIKFRSEGFQEILSSGEARALCEEAGAQILANANANNNRGGVGYKMSSRYVYAYGSRRNMTFVYTTDRKSCIAESEDKALSRAL